MRLGIAGCGEVVARGHLPILRDMPGIEVVGITDVSPQRLAEVGDLLGLDPAQRHSSHTGLIERAALDVLLVATPPSARHQIVVDAVDAGLFVLCEKPLATSIDEADRLLVALDERGGRVMMCHNYAFFPEFLWLSEMARSGIVGRITTVVLRALGANPWPGTAAFRPGWRDDPEMGGGGRFIDTGIHALYLLEDLLGAQPTEVSADTFFGPGAQVEDRCLARYRAGDAVGMVEIGAGQGGITIEVVGTEGRAGLEYGVEVGDFSCPPDRGYVVRDGQLVLSPAMRGRGMFTPQFYDYVVDRVASGDDPEVHSARHGRRLLELIFAAYASGAQGRTIPLPLDVTAPV